MQKSQLIVLACEAAIKHQLPDYIICGVCERESSWNVWAYRYEPGFYEHYVKPLGLAATESFGRSTSWGLMQTMGQSVREIGYTGDLPQLCEPETGLEWGCRLFAHKLGIAGGDLTKALLLWNGGGNPAYAPELLAMADTYKAGTSA